ncbi:MAG: membrane protein insertion efficiency factor YidD [Gammaproteobacteria bacterium RIFCSPHIGHO2_12_FULL_38_14]|nr:MAG: membrane protein insertion efficiency factor YidD [Gammaproteobacteria bacterium RIFCSPHIGHO2_12_FULL_38_14]
MLLLKKTLTGLLLSLIFAYRFLLKPFLPCACRFEPSCSQYAIDSIKIHGSINGVCLTLKRLLRCHPWHPGGVDPVK